MKPIIICADDFAQSAGIDAAIIALIQQGRLSATSCMTLSPRWPAAAMLITKEIRDKADIGLHLDFTQYTQPLKYPLPLLIARAVSHSLPVKKIHAAINTQLDNFEKALGTQPDYVDGHQHVHQLPQIREVLLNILSARYGDKLPWLRIARPPRQAGFKAGIIRQLGAKQLASQAKQAGFRCSELLLGVYDFDGNAEDYQRRLSVWLNLAQNTETVCTLMCHPSIAETTDAVSHGDPILGARVHEYQVFNSAPFLGLLKSHQLNIGRGQALTN